jgi:hypothetical protein
MKTSLTREDIINKIKASCYMVLPDGKTTICMLSMENGYTIKGISACVDPANFDFEIGRKYAFDDAVRQVWPLEGYLLAEKIYWDRAQPVATTPHARPTLTPERVRAMKDAGVWKNKRKRKTIATRMLESDGKAPWGYKKDGTPKKRPGRPAK